MPNCLLYTRGFAILGSRIWKIVSCYLDVVIMLIVNVVWQRYLESKPCTSVASRTLKY